MLGVCRRDPGVHRALPPTSRSTGGTPGSTPSPKKRQLPAIPLEAQKASRDRGTSACLRACLPICLSVCLSAYLSVCLPIRLSVCLSVCPLLAQSSSCLLSRNFFELCYFFLALVFSCFVQRLGDGKLVGDKCSIICYLMAPVFAKLALGHVLFAVLIMFGLLGF